MAQTPNLLVRSFDSLLRRRRFSPYVFLVFFLGLLMGLNLRIFEIIAPNSSTVWFPTKEIGTSLIPPRVHRRNDTIRSSSWHVTASTLIDQLEGKLVSLWNDLLAANQPGNSTLHVANLYRMATNRSTAERSLVLATHLSVDRVKDRLPLLLDFWNGPSSIAIYICDSSQITKLSQTLRELPLSDQRRILGGDCIFHFLMEILESSSSSSYPHNMLRNLAMQYDFETNGEDFCLATDADFVPTWNAHAKLIQLLYPSNDTRTPCLGDPLPSSMLRNKTALVLPVFNIVPPSGEKGFDAMVKIIPRTRLQLIQLYHQNISQQWTYKAGHQSNNYSQWLKRDSNTCSSYPIIPSKGYEPYFIAPRHLLPKYWEAFRGFGLDKQSFVAQVILEGFQFRVLRDFYLIHLSHPSNRNYVEREHNIVEWQKHFKPYLKQHYSNATAQQKRFFNIPFLQA